MARETEHHGLELRNVSLIRGGREILRDISWNVPRGACAAILGPNGSGKSTLARILTGYLWPTRGEVAVDGQRFGQVDLNELRKRIRLVQSAGPFDVDPALTARQVVLTGLFGTIGLFDIAADAQAVRADHLLKQLGLFAIRDARYSTLSSGERVRVLIARALILPPTVLLLDELTAGLDLLAREQVLATVQALFSRSQQPPTVVIITHHVEELPPATSQVLLLDDGSVADSGTPQGVLTTESLRRVYRCPLKVVSEAGRYYVRVDPAGWNSLIDH